MSNETSNIIVNISRNDEKVNCKIQIRLNDECRNGHEDFAITADFWQVGNPRTDKYLIYGGCCHDEILQHFPHLETFTRLHLCDFNGAPMYAVGNGMYHAFPGRYHSKNAGPAELARYYRIPAEIAEKLCAAADKDHFRYLVEELKIPQMWKAESDAAIALLETMTGNEQKFISKATRSNYEPMSTEERAAILQRIEAGYYTPEAIKARQQQERDAEIQRQIDEHTKDFNRATEAAKTELKVNTALSRKYPEKKGDWFYWHHDKSVTISRQFNETHTAEVEKMMRKIDKDIKVLYKNR